MRKTLLGLLLASATLAQAHQSIDINLTERTLTYNRETADADTVMADPVVTYPIAPGSEEYPTPTGQFYIWSIDKEPDWCPDPNTAWLTPTEKEYLKEHKCIPYWDPLNPFTRYRLRFYGAYSIHGTKYANVETQKSHGCVRMRAKDITDLVENKGLQEGTPVTIHD